MLKFRAVSVQDFEKVEDILTKSNIKNCEYCYPTLLVWSHRHPSELAIEEDTLFVRSEGHEHMWYLFPKGKMEPEKAINLILEDAKSHGLPISIYGIDKEDASIIEEKFQGKLELEVDRDGADYIYTQEDLANLPGKNYQKKRNHVSRFLREHPDYKFVEITDENKDKARKYVDTWCTKYEHDDDWDFISEKRGINELLDNFDRLKLSGAMIEVDDEVVAMTVAAPINDEMVDIMIEKAYHEMNGAYAIINRDFARNCLSKFKYINREDDLGLENLRKAKLSYFPCEILEKYTARGI